jgi:hypothetical protein
MKANLMSFSNKQKYCNHRGCYTEKVLHQLLCLYVHYGVVHRDARPSLGVKLD